MGAAPNGDQDPPQPGRCHHPWSPHPNTGAPEGAAAHGHRMGGAALGALWALGEHSPSLCAASTLHKASSVLPGSSWPAAPLTPSAPLAAGCRHLLGPRGTSCGAQPSWGSGGAWMPPQPRAMAPPEGTGGGRAGARGGLHRAQPQQERWMLGWDLGAGRGRVTYCDTPPHHPSPALGQENCLIPSAAEKGKQNAPVSQPGHPPPGVSAGGDGAAAP